MWKKRPTLQRKNTMNDSGQLSIDFIVGLSIFMIALIIASTMAAGLLVGLQSKHVDYDAVAYRTAVMLVEDPGEPVQPVGFSFYHLLTEPRITQWEMIDSPGQKQFAKRFGLAVSKSTPAILSEEKFYSFTDSTFYTPDDIKNKLFFSDYPYNMNIKIQLQKDDGTWENVEIGDNNYDNSQCGYIRRVCYVKESGTIVINSYPPVIMPPPPDGRYNVDIYTSDLINSGVGPTYQLDPYRDDIKIRMENIDSLAIDPITGVTLSNVYCSYRPVIGTGGDFITIDGIDFSIKADDVDVDISPPFGLTSPVTEITDTIETTIKAGYLIDKTDIDNPVISITYQFDPATAIVSGTTEIYNANYPGPIFTPVWMEVRVW